MAHLKNLWLVIEEYFRSVWYKLSSSSVILSSQELMLTNIYHKETYVKSSPGGLVVERLVDKKCHSATTNPIRYGVFMLQVSLVFHTIVPLIDLSNTA